MSSDRLVFDTNVIIRHGWEKGPRPGFVSSVVLQELTAGAADTTEIRWIGAVRRAAENDGLLLTPDSEDWYEAGKVLNSLFRGLRSRRTGRAITISKEEQQRLIRDVLIARSAKRVNAAVVTYNLADFEKIRRFCNVRIIEPAHLLR